jgi:hypothetical protein
LDRRLGGPQSRTGHGGEEKNSIIIIIMIIIIIIIITTTTTTDKICLLIDVAIPSDRTVIQKEVEKKLKYKNLNIEIQLMWNMKRFVIPVTTGATGIVSKGLQRYLETVTGKHSTHFVQKKSCTWGIARNKESATV